MIQVCLYKMSDPEGELLKLGCDRLSAALSASQARHLTLKLRGIPADGALLLQREALSLGAEAALPEKASRLGKKPVDLILMGTEGQLEKLCSRLDLQREELPSLGEQIRKLLAASRRRRGELQLGNARFPLGERTLIMGILNVTPDSFSDGGRYNLLEQALQHARRMVAEGADIIDIGGESTRPGAQPVSAEEELRRVIPVIEALKKDPAFTTPLSIDTYKAEVARAALELGIDMVNDVWGFKADPGLATVAASFKVPVCLMHNRKSNVYRDLIPDILAELQESIDLALQAGISSDRIIIDPGIGFGKDWQQNLEVMHHLGDFLGLGYPLLVGTSRKSMIGKTLDLPVDDRLEGTAATVAYSIAAGADLVRVHDVKEMRRVAQMCDAMVRR
ncbi:MAG: dihydropteroate synthase [Firmicutes bacterium]|nr:dihydropteroate synthase [Bacillota bacterium]